MPDSATKAKTDAEQVSSEGEAPAIEQYLHGRRKVLIEELAFIEKILGLPRSIPPSSQRRVNRL